MSHLPRRELTPSTPKPSFGHPNPRAIVGGNASGNDEAEKKEMESVGVVESFVRGKRMSSARCTFSGIDKNEGILYQSCVWTVVFLHSHEKPSLALSGHLVGWIPKPSRPPSHPSPAPPKRLNITTFPRPSSGLTPFGSLELDLGLARRDSFGCFTPGIAILVRSLALLIDGSGSHRGGK